MIGAMVLYRAPLLGLLVGAVIALTACGSSTTTTTTASGGALTAAKQKCLEATKQIQNSTARSVAEQACDQISSSNENVKAAASKAKQACRTAAGKIPIASLKQAAEQECDKITG